VPDLKLVTWNMQWMNDLFVSGNGPVQFKPDDTGVRGPRSNSTVALRCRDLAGVLIELDPEAVVITEGPNQTRELQHFFDSHVPGTWTCVIQPTKGSSQCIGIAVRTDRGDFAETPLTWFDTREGNDHPLAVASQPFVMDSDGDGIDELHKFERLPLYAELHLAGGEAVRVVGLHLKSKGIFSAYEWSKWWSVADANRKKILAQCRQIRREFLDPYLTEPATAQTPLLVCGDINDGPGFDTSERRLLDSGVERLMGSIWHPQRTLGNALFDTLSPKDQADEDFDSIATTSFKDPIFDTYIQSWIDHVLYTRNASAGWVHDANVVRTMASGERIWREFPFASDHQPVVVTVTV